MENKRIGPFQVLQRLGTSRRQQVFRAMHESQQREVALKFFSFAAHLQWESGLEKIQRETEQLKKLRHENLVRTYGVGVYEAESQVFFANELVEGEALSKLLARRGKLTPDLVVEYGHQIAQALHYLHEQGVIHTKLSPDNILVTPDDRVKITNVRLNRPGKRRWDEARKRDLEIAAYMAPEQFTAGATEKSDFYALGVILFELLTGKLPYPPENLGRIAKAKKEIAAPSVAEQVMSCPIWLDKIVTQMVQSRPKQRPHSARAITFAFEEIRKIDASQRSAASQVAGNFNPLNAGVDKTKARVALGKESATEKVELPPFWQRTSFMIIVLLAMIAIGVWSLVPPSPHAILDQAQVVAASRDPGQWRLTAAKMKPLMESADEGIAARATELHFRCKERILEMNGRSGVRAGARGLYSRNVKSYIDATQDFLAGDRQGAKAVYERLVQEVTPDGEERHVHSAAAKQLQQLSAILALPKDPVSLDAMIQQYAKETDRLKLMQGEKVLQRVIRQFGRSAAHVEVCNSAKEQLRRVRTRLEEIRDSEPR